MLITASATHFLLRMLLAHMLAFAIGWCLLRGMETKCGQTRVRPPRLSPPRLFASAAGLLLLVFVSNALDVWHFLAPWTLLLVTLGIFDGSRQHSAAFAAAVLVAGLIGAAAYT